MKFKERERENQQSKRHFRERKKSSSRKVRGRMHRTEQIKRSEKIKRAKKCKEHENLGTEKIFRG